MILLSDLREYTSELYLDEEEKKKIHVFLLKPDCGDFFQEAIWLFLTSR
jgi:hypothetical protein